MDVMTKAGLDVAIASDLTAVDDVCREARALLSAEGLDSHAFAVDLLLREFINNAIMHGNRCDPEKHVHVAMRIGRTWITLRIADEGRGFAWRGMRRTPPDGAATSGRGLAIGTEYAQRLQFNREGNQVMLWIRKDVKKGQKDADGFTLSRDDAELHVGLGEKLTAVEVQTLQPALKAALADGALQLVFDLAATTTLDSSGIGLLIAANNSVTARGGAVRLDNVCCDIMKLLQTMRLADRLHATVAER